MALSLLRIKKWLKGGTTLLFFFLGWAFFASFRFGIPDDSVEGVVFGLFYCDPQCQEKITLDYGKPDSGSDILVYATRRFLGCKYFTPTGNTVRNYWTRDWSYERSAYLKGAVDAGILISGEGLPDIEFDWESPLPMKSVPLGSECPEEIDGLLNSDYWEKVPLPDGFSVKPIFEREDG